MPVDTIKILVALFATFSVGILCTPILTHYLFKYQMWKKTSVKKTVDGQVATISAQLHNDEARKTPRMGGIVVWGSVLIVTLALTLLGAVFPDSLFEKLAFLSRNQTWIPLAVLIASALVGAIDDYLVCRESGTYAGGGLSLRVRLGFVAGVGLLVGYWFVMKLGVTSVMIPFVGDIALGYLMIPLVVFMMIAIYSGGIIDGVDGLSGGVFAVIFGSYTIIALSNNQIDLAAFTAAVVGGLLAFLWFNIPPARFFNSETGTMALTTSLVVVAFLTNAIAVLPIIAFLLVATSASSVLQIASKRLRGGKKVFLVAPLHNHFQALGWPPYKVTMRYWVLAVMFAVVGIIIQLGVLTP